MRATFGRKPPGGMVSGETEGSQRSPRSVFMEVPQPYLTMASFVEGLRDGERAAMRAFYLMYAPLLRDQARRVGVAPDERDELVTTVLGDVLLHLQEADLVPRDLSRYVVGSLRNRARNAHRDRERRAGRDEALYTSATNSGERVIAECHSEYGFRSASPPDDDDTAHLAFAIAKLAAHSAQALAPDDAVLMIGLSRRVPLRDLAAHMTISYGAARVRVHRLRERFRKLALQYVESLEAAEREEMKRFFRRAGVALYADEGRTRPPQPRARPMTADHDGGNDRDDQ